MNSGEQRAFFDRQWPGLRTILITDGPEAVVAAILGHGSDDERTALFRFARHGLALADWEGKNLDAYVTVADAGCRWLADRAQNGSPEERTEFLAVLAELTFNLAADLADCWEGDGLPRERRHFERGMQAGEQSVGLREELNKPDSSKHLGWWGFGYHQLRLGHTDGAVDCMERSLEHARRAARQAGEPDAITSRASFPVLISAGYLGLARIADGEPSGPDLYGEALAAFRAQLDDPSRCDDARFGIEQLERVRGFLA